MQHTFGDATHHFGLGSLQRCGGCGLVTGCDGFFDLADEGTDARTTGFVDGETGFVLTGAFLGLGRISHDVFPLSGSVEYLSRKRPGPGFINRLILTRAGLTRM